MNLDKFTGPGSTPSRRRFWDKVAGAVSSLQKTEGRNASVQEHQGMGTVINFPDQTPSALGMGACCTDGECSILSESDCVDGGGNYLGNGSTCDDVDCTLGACCAADGSCTETNEEDCTTAGGTFQGYGTDCDPNPCPQPTGACCVGSDCTIETADDCAGMGGTYQGDGTTCDPNPCEEPPPPCCNGCFFTPDGINFYHNKTVHATGTGSYHSMVVDCDATMDMTSALSYDNDCNLTLIATGSGHQTSGGIDLDVTWEDHGGGYAWWYDGGPVTNDILYPLRCCGLFTGSGTCSTMVLEDIAEDCSGHVFDIACDIAWTVTVTYADPCDDTC